MRHVLRQMGPKAVAWAGFVVGLCWAFFGSLVLGLGVSAAVPVRLFWLWLGGEAGIVGLAALGAALAAAPEVPGE